jgi:crotonobetainyl-CoA:carnitine CoA-transferase CaiB-like acyl-CoA transferase
VFKLPLLGIRVLDLTMSWAGPHATRLLADMGAEVIKIEAVRHWDLLRSYTGQPPTVERVWDRSPYFNHYNRNKYGCSLDLTTERGRELFLKLAEEADVVIENYRAEAMDNLGLSYERLRDVNPQLIVVSMPGHGKTGPESGFVAFGTNVEQLAGLAHLTGYEGGPPHKTGISYGDPMAGIATAGAIALALWDRRRTGFGQHVEVPQRENLVGAIGEFIVGYSMSAGSGSASGGNGREPVRKGNRHTSMAPHGCYQCSGEDQWITIACEDDEQFAALCGVIGRPELADDDLFADVVSRYCNQGALDEAIIEWTRTQEKQTAAEALQAAGVPAMPVLTVRDVFEDEHLRARRFFEAVSHTIAGEWEMEGPSWRMSETPGHVRMPPPSFGEHNRYVFGELLGLTEEEIAALEAEGITGTVPDWSVHE